MPPVLNPSADIFAPTAGALYVDKTELIAYTNSVMASTDHFTAIARPPRFGKTMTARMLAAFYSKGADTRAFFERCRIAQDDRLSRSTHFRQALLSPVPWDTYLNRCNVLFWDLADYAGDADSTRLTTDLCRAVRSQFSVPAKFPTPSINVEAFYLLLENTFQATGECFYFVIDNWDALFLQPPVSSAFLADWIMLLRLLFKNPYSHAFLQGAFIAGILPTVCCPFRGCLEDFYDFSPYDAGLLKEQVGLTEEETRSLCGNNKDTFLNLLRRFGGYTYDNAVSLLNTGYVMEALAGRTTSPDTIITLLSQLPKLQPDASERLQTLLSGASVKLCFNTLSADLTRFRGTADELLMLCVYLGLLTFDVEPEFRILNTDQCPRSPRGSYFFV